MPVVRLGPDMTRFSTSTTSKEIVLQTVNHDTTCPRGETACESLIEDLLRDSTCERTKH